MGDAEVCTRTISTIIGLGNEAHFLLPELVRMTRNTDGTHLVALEALRQLFFKNSLMFHTAGELGRRAVKQLMQQQQNSEFAADINGNSPEGCAELPAIDLSEHTNS